MNDRARRRRVVVTGMGAVSPLGLTLADTWAAALRGQSGVRRIVSFDPEFWPVQIGGEVVGYDVEPYLDDATRSLHWAMPRGIQLALGASAMAADDCGLDLRAFPNDRLGISLGAATHAMTISKINELRHLAKDYDPPRYRPFDERLEMRLPQVAVVQTIADRWRAAGPCLVISTACAAGTQAIGTALRTIQRGEADIMLAGGFDDMVHEIVLLSFSLLGVMSQLNDDPQRASRPFNKDRDGFVIGEGAAVMVLEEREHALRRGARIYAELAGFGTSTTTEHITDSSRDGRHPARAMTHALDDAGIEPARVGYINAHGTSTRDNDRAETAAIRRALGDHADKVAVSSTKSMTGHLVHGAGALEAQFAVMALVDQIAPPTINYDAPDPVCDLDYVPNVARPLPLEVTMSNSFAFGGNNAAVVFTRESPDA